MPEPESGAELSAPAATRGRQLWLLPPPRPFVERFGHAFFRALPREPGVYFFFDDQGRLIYVGKAKCLRQRLGSYRHVHPDRDSRKTWRLVNAVREIRWEICADHATALLRENRLLREFRPRFNRANVWPWSAVYLGLGNGNGDVRVRVGRDLTTEFQWFGSFKPFAIHAFHALRRLVKGSYDATVVPLDDFTSDGEREFGAPRDRLAPELLRRFLKGESRELLDGFENHALGYGARDLACQNRVLNDLVMLERFYERGPLRNRRMIGGEGLISPEEMSDQLALQQA
jgi:hypothetical protein